MKHMPYSQLFFTLKGRIRRSTFWVRFTLPYLVIFTLLGFVDLAMDTWPPDHILGAQQSLFVTIALLPSIAIGVKRLHDRDRSGWLYVLAFVPLINIWILVEMGLLRGTVGRNIYGPDPLEGKSQQPRNGAKSM